MRSEQIITLGLCILMPMGCRSEPEISRTGDLLIRNVTVIDGTGKYVIPGMIDVHA